jgi:uncharacterized protein (TIGR00375 family)
MKSSAILSEDTLFADLHIHSCFSIATSSQMLPEKILEGCRKKGIRIIGSGDALHARWREMWEAEEVQDILVAPTTEVEDRDRVHHLVLLESFDTFRDLSCLLEPAATKLEETGRPHLRLGADEIARAVHACGGLIGPAHAFTPWTSLYASFGSLEECYGREQPDFLELGLSADSSYGAGIPELSGIPFLSCSDAHSPDPVRLGREFTGLRPGSLTAEGVIDAVRHGRIALNAGFYPEEGKYNRTACCRCFRQFSWEEAEALGWRCPDDRGRIKKGVADRAARLSSGPPGERPPYLHLIPLGEIIRTACGASSPATRGCRSLYDRFIDLFGNEIRVLIDVPVDELAELDTTVAAAISCFRSSRVRLIPGGGGKYGSFSLEDQELQP